MTEESEKKREWHASDADFFKSIYEHLKHIATLASASVLLLSTFLEKLFAKPLQSWLVGLSLGSLLLALIASLASYASFLLLFPRPDFSHDDASTLKHFSVGALVVTWLAFVIGIGSIAAFFLLNWYARK